VSLADMSRMTREFFQFEIKQQLRTPLLWLMAAMFGLLALAAISSDAVQLGSAIGNVDRNAPVVIVTFLGLFTILGLLLSVTFISNALLRDFDLGTADLLFSTPLRKRDFLIGRFAAAFAACLVVYIAVAIGLLVGQFMPWVDPDRLGPLSLSPYVWGFAILVIPNLLFTSALLALLAVTTRSLLTVYLGVIGFFVLWRIAGTITADLDNAWLATVVDPFGIRAFSRTIRYWSSEERNSQLPQLVGYLLLNRVVWSALAIGMLGTAFAAFKTQRSGTGKRWFRRASPSNADRVNVGDAGVVRSAMAAPRISPRFSIATGWSQLAHQLRFDTIGVLRSVPFLVMLTFAVINFAAAANTVGDAYGTRVYPVTSHMLEALRGSYSFMLIFIVMFYAGELVWKERAAKLGEVTDACPTPNWVPLLAKMGTLMVVVVVFQAVGGAVAIGWQLVRGYTTLEPTLYIKTLLLDAIPFVLMGGLALVLQVLCNHKFIGFGALIAMLVLRSVLGLLAFEHNLYNYASAPAAPYSDMNGYGHFLRAHLWFQGYWALALLVLLLLSSAFWVRGVTPTHRDRRTLAWQRLRGRGAIALASASMAFAAVGSFIFWNTNIRNDYIPSDRARDEQQRYEFEYRQYKDLPQPRIIAVATDVDLWPEEQTARIRGSYKISNPHITAIADLHVQMKPDSMRALEVGGARISLDDKRLGYRIYHLDRPLQPAEVRVIHFDLEFGRKGFGNVPAPTEFVDNGTFFNSEVLPSFGYDERRQLQDRNERRKRGLGDAPRMPKLEDERARAHTYIGASADWIDFKTTICTAPDQIAVAPGYLKREHRRDGRRCFDYEMDRPMLAFYAYLSARWQVRRDSHQGIAIEIYYDAKHPYNVDRMIDSVKQSLTYFQSHFTPYQHKQVRILEFPGYQRFAQSFANTIPYSESAGFIADLRDRDAIDYVFYVTAHEVAHQWWAHQVIGANVQGATVMSESLAEYSALMVMEKAYGRAMMRQFLRYELDRYLSGRSAELVEELPLFRVEDQAYIHYSKGGLVFYRLREELGEEAVNRALKKYLIDKGYQHAPFTTSRELLQYLRAEASPDQQMLITDLFETICFYDNRVQQASARKLSDGRFEVSIHARAAKWYADGKGKETAGALDEWVDVGVFATGASGKERDEKVLYLERHRLTTAELKVTVVVDSRPDQVGIDPYNKLIDRVPADNRRSVSW
jgi:ABC-2 type transport system permease protein